MSGLVDRSRDGEVVFVQNLSNRDEPSQGGEPKIRDTKNLPS